MTDTATARPVVARARVNVAVEVTLSQPWPGSTSIAEIHANAAREAEERIKSMVGAAPGMRVLEATKVQAVIVEDRQ